MTSKEIIEYMESLRNEEQRVNLMRFFKTQRPSDYGFGDQFLGIKNPQTHEVVKFSKDLPVEEVPALLTSKWHEVRLCGFLILVDRFERLAKKRLEHDGKAVLGRDNIIKMYLEHAEFANNWDLVDLSVQKIIGSWLLLPTTLGSADGKADYNFDYKIELLDSLADSPCLWKQRMSIVCTSMPTRHGDPSWCLRYAEKHLTHPHDLMHKAVGWMLREVGEKVGYDLVRDFIMRHINNIPRTTLRYAIEKLGTDERQYWLNLPRK